MNFIVLTKAMNEKLPMTAAEFYALVDSILPEIEGAPPSTWLKWNVPTSFGGLPEGTFLGAKVAGHAWLGTSLTGFDAGFNPVGISPFEVNWQTSSSLGQIPVLVNGNHHVCWSVVNAMGQEVVPRQLAAVNIPLSINLNNLNLPIGTYVVPMADTPTDLTECSPDPRLNVQPAIIALDQVAIKSLLPGDLVVAINGPRYGEIPAPGSYRVELVSPMGAMLEMLSDDLVIIQNVPKSASGSFLEVTLKVTFSDGTVRIRTFQPDWSQPMVRMIVDKEEPTLLALNTRSVATGPGRRRSETAATPPIVFPGEGLSVSGKDFTGNAPCAADEVSLRPRPTKPPVDGSCGNALNDQGRTRVSFTVTDGPNMGVEYFAGIFYVDTGWINFITPTELIPGQMVSIRVILNGTPSFQAITAVVGPRGHDRPF